MKQYNKINNLVGWLTFAVAAFTYCMTIEPTASFWDCPEFITTGYKLEVGHPPGAPFFMLTANLFSQFASDATQVAKMVNIMSALMSAACILFLFWSITHLTKKLICPDDKEMTTGKLITIMGAGLVGALAYTWSDTFWFSAVEGEVYAYSSLFTAVVFWLILKWENRANEPHSDRWLILIAYLTGLSIGVHLLNLLCIPAIVLVYYYKKNPNANLKGSLIALAGSMILVAVVLYGIVPGIVKVGGWFELLFVNDFGLPFNTGVIIYMIILAASIIWGVYESYTVKSRKRMNISFLTTVGLLGIPFYGHGWSSVFIGIIVLAILAIYLFANIGEKYRVSARTLNTSLLAMMMIVVGYSSYAVIVIRSSANTPMDQNSPEDIFTLGEYLGREQYGTRPLFYGQTYASKPALKPTEGGCVYDVEEGAPVYQRKEKERPDEKDSYEIVRHKTEYKYAQNMLFPRMYSDTRPNFANQYQAWAGRSNGPTYTVNGETITRPSFGNNMRYFFNYQLGHMYWRYFMWNFSGRQNDIQGYGDIMHGNWITGIKFLDELRLGNQDELPDNLKNEKANNKYYMLPFLLGLLGMFYQYRKGKTGKQDFWVVMLLFIMTGIAIIVFLNQTPMEPRERDYAYAGSFYAYAIWIGLGVLSIWEFLNKKIKNIDPRVSAIAVTTVCLFAIPVNMAAQNWDDHNRHARYATTAHARNYLNSCAPNAILFTYGDNDTFPLWYVQEVEGVRRDVRVVNLSLLSGSWYIDQMKRKAYESSGVPISFTHEQYRDGKRDYVLIRDQFKEGNLKDVMEFVASDLPQTKLQGYIKELDFIPTRNVILPVDSAKVIANGTVKPQDADQIVKDLRLHLPMQGLTKSQLMVLDILSTNNWERPVYFGIGLGSDAYMGLEKYFQLEGAAYRVVPIETKEAEFYDYGRIDSDILYDNIMNKFEWGNIKDPKVNIDFFHDQTIAVMKYRNTFLRLAQKLYDEGKQAEAVAVLDKSLEEIPLYQVPADNSMLFYIPMYYELGETEKANHLLNELATNNYQMLKYANSLEPKFANTPSIQQEERLSIEVIKQLLAFATQAGQKELAQELQDKVLRLYNPSHISPDKPLMKDTADKAGK